jgi:hypothetical protein
MDDKVRPDAFSDTQIISTGYVFIGITSAVAVARLAIYYVAPKRLMVEDGLVFFAYICNLAMCLMYISLAPGAQTIPDVESRRKVRLKAILCGAVAFLDATLEYQIQLLVNVQEAVGRYTAGLYICVVGHSESLRRSESDPSFTLLLIYAGYARRRVNSVDWS